MNKGLIGVLCLVLCCAFLPAVTLNNEQNFATADTVYNTTNISNVSSSSNSLQDITITNDAVYVSDNTQKRIYIYNLSTHTTTTQDGIGTTASPCLLSLDYADNLVYTDSELDQICIVGSDDKYDTFISGESELKISRIYDIAQTTDNVIYAIVSRHSNYYLIKKTAQQTKFVQYATLPALVDGCKLTTNLTGDKILLLNNDVLYKVTSAGCTVLDDYAYPALANIVSIGFDHRDDLYILTSTGSMIHSKTSEYTTITLSDSSNILDFCISPSDNTIYFVTPNKLTCLPNAMAGDVAFLNAVSSAPVVDITTDVLTAPTTTITTTQNTYLYTYDNLLSKTKTVNADTAFTVLDNTNDNFYYVLDTSGEYNLLGYILKSCATPTTNNLPAKTYQTLYSGTAIYPFPTTLQNSSTEGVRVLATLPKNAIITTTTSNKTPVDYNGASFVFVTTTTNGTQYSGYIDTRYLTEKSEEACITPIFVSNATTRDEIEVFDDDECSVVSTTLSKGTLVQILSTNNGISYIEWQEGSVSRYGYTKYQNLDDGSISLTQIIGFLLMLVGIVACLITISVINRNNIRRKMFYED